MSRWGGASRCHLHKWRKSGQNGPDTRGAFVVIDVEMSRIFVGNLNFGMRDDELRAVFAEYGDVEAANVSLDGFTRRSNGYGFVEMPDADEARSAVDALNGRDVNGRPIEVRLVIPWTAPRISHAVRLEA